MAKQSNQKLKLLYLLRILLEQTDENCGLTLAQISDELAKYNVSAARKSLYDDIESLRLFGVNVCVKRDRYVKYYIAKRDLSTAELKYIIDALSDFDAIPRSAAYDLIQKLIKIHGGKGRSYCGTVEEPTYKTPAVISAELAKSIELIDSALLSGKKIYFKQFEWNSLKQRALLRGGKKISVTPLRLACDGKYILYAYDGKTIAAYDVDTLIEVEISSENVAPPEEYKSLPELQKFNIEPNSTNIVNAVNIGDGECHIEYENLRFEVANSFAGEIFRKFGLGVTVLSSREDVFEISVKVKLDGSLFSWIFANAKSVRIISPERAINAYKDMLLLALDNANKN